MNTISTFNVVKFDIKPNDLLIYKLVWALGDEEDSFSSEDVHRYMLIKARTIEFGSYSNGDSSLNCRVTNYETRPNLAVNLDFDHHMVGILNENLFLLSNDADIREKIMPIVEVAWHNNPTLVWSKLDHVLNWIDSIVLQVIDGSETQEQDKEMENLDTKEWTRNEVLGCIERIRNVEESRRSKWAVSWDIVKTPNEIREYSAHILGEIQFLDKGGPERTETRIYSFDLEKNGEFLNSNVKTESIEEIIISLCSFIAYNLNERSRLNRETNKMNDVLFDIQRNIKK